MQKHHGVEIIPSNFDESVDRRFPAPRQLPQGTQLVDELHSSVARIVFAARQAA
jgi:hypothetical protein